MLNELQHCELDLAVKKIGERLKDLSQGTCIEVFIEGDERVVHSVISHYRDLGVDIDCVDSQTSGARLLLTA